MQNELRAMNPGTIIAIRGMNAIGSESGNDATCLGRDLPWIQETFDQQVRTDWEVEWRDVAILDENNVLIAIYNLTDHDLQTMANYDELKQMLLGFAGE